MYRSPNARYFSAQGYQQRARRNINAYCPDNVAFGLPSNQAPVAPKLSDMALLQAYAGACHVNGIGDLPGFHGGRGRYPWMDIEVTGKALGISYRQDGSSLSLSALAPGRGAYPLLCPAGSPCNVGDCSAPAEVMVSSNREFSMAYVCRAHVDLAVERIRVGGRVY